MILSRTFLSIRNVAWQKKTIICPLTLNVINKFSTSSIKYDYKLGRLGKSDAIVDQEHKNLPHDEIIPDKTNIELFLKGLEHLPGELKKFGQEWRELHAQDGPLFDTGDILKLFDFAQEETVKPWIVSTDSSYDLGQSTASFVNSPNKTSIFSGNVDTTLPDDEFTTSTGYCNITSPQKFKSFHRVTHYRECEGFTHIVFRCRGDGRSYLILLDMSGYLDVTWGNKHFYVLHTRGGPHWQVSFIPFSHFIRMNRGVIQDIQHPIATRDIKSFALTVCKVPGHFRLELDYIGVYLDNPANCPYPYEFYEYDHVLN